MVMLSLYSIESLGKTHQNHKYVGSKTSEEIDLLATRQSLLASLFFVLNWVLADEVAQNKCVSHCLKICFKGLCLPTSDIPVRSGSMYFKLSKNPSQLCPPLFQILVNSRFSHLCTNNIPHSKFLESFILYCFVCHYFAFNKKKLLYQFSFSFPSASTTAMLPPHFPIEFIQCCLYACILRADHFVLENQLQGQFWRSLLFPSFK